MIFPSQEARKEMPAAMKLPTFCPEPARTIESTDIPRGLISDLVLKRTFLEGIINLSRLIGETKLDYNVIYDVFCGMQKDLLIEIKGVVGHNYEFTLSHKGLQIAEEAYRKSRYSGPAPVSLGAYRAAVQAQAFKPQLTQESLTEHLSDLVLSEDIICNLGAALMTGGAIFLYGPTGNGKTSIAERLKRIYHDYVYVPYAIEVSGEVLSVFDPIVHEPAKEQPEDIDPRWLLCHRPFLTVGGEMRADMLEPHLDQNRHIVRSPVQVRANNGILVIDDFGRQRIQPRDLLNRWIVPLDRHVDYISWFGTSIEIPFELIVVFATNLNLASLAEEAFLRRIKNKIRIDRITDETFLEIMRRQCGQRGIEYQPDVGGYAVRECLEHSREGLRACYPRDLLDVASGIAAFQERPPRFDHDDVDRAISIYFMQ
jgi:energy-coupling factor transporter ATP-binding protein EcfA2